MSNKIEYIFSLQDKISAKLGGITTTSDKAAAVLSGVRDKISSVDAVFNTTGRTIGSLKMKIDALQAEKEWIPANNLPAIKEYNKQINQLTKEINDLEVASTGGKFKNWAKSAFSSLPGAQLISNPLVALMAGLGFAGKTAMNNDESMAKINLTAQLDEKGLADLSVKLKEITKKNRADIIMAPVGLEKIISQTGDLSLSLDILDSAQKGAKAGFVDMDIVSGALAQTLSVVGKENTNATEVLDTFFAAKRVGAGEFQDFARYMPGLIAGAKNMGIAYQEVAGTFAFMTGKGQSAERAAVLMENAFSVLGRGEVREKLSKAGVNIFDSEGKVRRLVDVFGDLQGVMTSMTDEQKSTFLENIGVRDKEAKNAFSILTSDVNKFNDSMNAVSNSTGEADAALALSINSVQNAINLWNTLKVIALSIGEVVMPLISAGLSVLDVLLIGVSDVLDSTISLFSWLFKLYGEGNPALWAITTAVGAYTIALGANYVIAQKTIIISGIKKLADIASTAATWSLTTAQMALNAAFYASPLGWIALGIGAVVGAVMLCWNKFEGFRVVILGIWGVIKEFGSSLFDSIVNPFKQIIKGIGAVCSAIGKLMRWEFKEAAAAAKAGFKDIGSGMVSANPVGIAYNAVNGGDYKHAWEQGKQDGRDSWARSQAKKEEKSVVGPDIVNSPYVVPTPAVPIAPKSTTSKVLNLSDKNDPRNLSESIAYSTITKKMVPGSIKLMPTEATQEKIISAGQVIGSGATYTDDRTQNYEPAKENYLFDIMQNVRRIAAVLVLPATTAIAAPSDAYALPGDTNNSGYITTEHVVTTQRGKTINMTKMCDQIVIQIQNTDNKGTDKIREEIMKILNELGDE